MVRADRTAPEIQAPARQAPRQHSRAERAQQEVDKGPTRHAPEPYRGRRPISPVIKPRRPHEQPDKDMAQRQRAPTQGKPARAEQMPTERPPSINKQDFGQSPRPSQGGDTRPRQGAKPAAATRGSGDREVVQTVKRPAEAALKSKGGQRRADPSSSSRGARQEDTVEGDRKKPKVLDKEPARASKRSNEEMQPAGSLTKRSHRGDVSVESSASDDSRQAVELGLHLSQMAQLQDLAKQQARLLRKQGQLLESLHAKRHKSEKGGSLCGWDGVSASASRNCKGEYVHPVPLIPVAPFIHLGRGEGAAISNPSIAAMKQVTFQGGGRGRHPLGHSAGSNISEGHKLLALKQLAPQFSPTQYRTLLAVSKKVGQCFQAGQRELSLEVILTEMKRLGMQPLFGTGGAAAAGPSVEPGPQRSWEKKSEPQAKGKGWLPPKAEEKKFCLIPGQLESRGREVPVRTQLVGGTFPGAVVISNQEELEKVVRQVQDAAACQIAVGPRFYSEVKADWVTPPVQVGLRFMVEGKGQRTERESTAWLYHISGEPYTSSGVEVLEGPKARTATMRLTLHHASLRNKGVWIPHKPTVAEWQKLFAELRPAECLQAIKDAWKPPGAEVEVLMLRVSLEGYAELFEKLQGEGFMPTPPHDFLERTEVLWLKHHSTRDEVVAMLAEQNRPDRVALEGGLDWCPQLAVVMKPRGAKVDFGVRFPKVAGWECFASDLGRDTRLKFAIRNVPRQWQQGELQDVLDRSGWTVEVEKKVGQVWVARSVTDPLKWSLMVGYDHRRVALHVERWLQPERTPRPVKGPVSTWASLLKATPGCVAGEGDVEAGDTQAAMEWTQDWQHPRGERASWADQTEMEAQHREHHPTGGWQEGGTAPSRQPEKGQKRERESEDLLQELVHELRSENKQVRAENQELRQEAMASSGGRAGCDANAASPAAPQCEEASDGLQTGLELPELAEWDWQTRSWIQLKTWEDQEAAIETLRQDRAPGLTARVSGHRNLCFWHSLQHHCQAQGVQLQHTDAAELKVQVLTCALNHVEALAQIDNTSEQSWREALNAMIHTDQMSTERAVIAASVVLEQPLLVADVAKHASWVMLPLTEPLKEAAWPLWLDNEHFTPIHTVVDLRAMHVQLITDPWPNEPFMTPQFMGGRSWEWPTVWAQQSRAGLPVAGEWEANLTRAKQVAGKSKTWRLCSTNLTGPGLMQKQLASWRLEDNEPDCWCVQECHIDQRSAPEHVKQAERSGYTLVLETTPPGTNEGGVGVMVKRHLQAVKVPGGPMEAYPGRAGAAAKLDQLEALGQWVRLQPGAVLVLGDFNQPLRQVRALKWAESLQGVLLEPPRPTCGASYIDYGLAVRMPPRPCLVTVEEGLTRPHDTVLVQLAGRMVSDVWQQQVVPGALPTDRYVGPQPWQPQEVVRTEGSLATRWARWTAKAVQWLCRSHGLPLTPGRLRRMAAPVVCQKPAQHQAQLQWRSTWKPETLGWLELVKAMEQGKNCLSAAVMRRIVSRCGVWWWQGRYWGPQQWLQTPGTARLEQSRAWVAELQRKDASDRQRAWRDFLRRQEQANPGWVHKCMKAEAPACQPTQLFAPSPLQQLATVVKPWQELWRKCPAVRQQDAPAMLYTTQVQRPDPDALKAVAGHMARKKPGWDNWTAKHFLQLPHTFWEDLASIFQQFEEHLQVPLQWTTVIVLLAKPVEQLPLAINAPVRPIALTAAPVRLWSKYRGELVRAVDREVTLPCHAGTAAVPCQAVSHELQLGFEGVKCLPGRLGAVACLDISKAYEHVQHGRVHEAAARHGLEGIAAAATCLYGGPRRVCYRTQTSAELRATAGILAGCSQATSWLKLILAPTMGALSHIEALLPNNVVDDISVAAFGTVENTRQGVLQGLRELTVSLRTLGLPLSASKSVVLSKDA
eukprot:6476867-Amphidinium_carterae.1